MRGRKQLQAALIFPVAALVFFVGWTLFVLTARPKPRKDKADLEGCR